MIYVIVSIYFTTKLDKHINTIKISKRDKTIINTVEQTRQFLKENKNILIMTKGI